MRSRRTPTPRSGHAARFVPALVGGALAVAACGVSTDVAVERADQIALPLPGVDPADGDTPGVEPDAPGSDAPGSDEAADAGAPTTTTGEAELPESPAEPLPTNTDDPVVTDPNAINFGDEKPARDRDAYLLAAFTDIEAWLEAEFEPAFG
ncbi:MAG: hypothetical protein AAGG08_07700, partial [Actinomycetota bacterium]